MRTSRLLALLVILALVGAACGGGRDDEKPSAGNGSTTTAPGGAAAIDTSACVTDPSSVTIEGDTIKLATSLPQSGLYSAFAEILRGEQAYLSYLNEELGGVEIAGKKYKVELSDKDDEYQSSKTVANVNEFVSSDGVFGLFNVVGTKNNLAIRDFVNEECVPNLLAATGSPAWGNHAYPWVLGTFLVPYSDEMQALVDYLKENKPGATVAILRASDDFGKAYVETFNSLIEGTDITVVKEETYNPEVFDTKAQVTSLAASDADVFILGATLLACPDALKNVAASGWSPTIYMSGTCTSKTLMAIAGEAGNGVLSVVPVMDPNDPQFADNEAMTLYHEKIPQYQPEADAGNGIVAYGWTAGAVLAHLLSTAEGPDRLSIMNAARNLTVEGVGLQFPGATFTTNIEDDWFLGESFHLVSYNGTFFEQTGELIDLDGKTADITPANLIDG